MYEELVKKIGRRFRTFGGGQGSNTNPLTAALKDKPFQFAGGVDVAEVVAAILEESGHAGLLAACKAAEQDLRERYEAHKGSAVDKLTLKIVQAAIEAAELEQGD